jgi:adenylate kinase family enzyme
MIRYRRIHITGASGTGTTTLGTALAFRLKYDFFDADTYFWEPTQPPFQTKRLKENRLAMISKDLSLSSAFVLSGSICGWNDVLEDSFDLVIYLRIPPEIRLARLRAREIERNGKINDEFIAWATRYDDGDCTVRSRALHERWLAQRHCEVLRIETDLSVEERLAVVLLRQSAPTGHPETDPLSLQP